MKILSIILFAFVCTNAYANDKLNCLRASYLDYTSHVTKYWSAKEQAFKRTHPKLHAQFSYLITEQINHNKMQEITIDYIIENHPKELNLKGSLYNMVPRYKHYAQEIYRELRTITEFDQLYFETESYKKENKMPVYEDLKAASKVLDELDSEPSVIEQKNLALRNSQRMVSSLSCGS